MPFDFFGHLFTFKKSDSLHLGNKEQVPNFS